MARKKLADAPAPDTRTMQERFEHYWPRLVDAKAELADATDVMKAANSAYRNILKEAKGAGLDADQLREALSINKRDPQDVTRGFTTLNQYLAWAGVPVGTQLGLFGDGKTVATAVEDAQQAGTEEHPQGNGAVAKADAYNKGFADFAKGVKRQACPYGAREVAKEWALGWDDAQEQAVGELGTGEAGRKKRERDDDKLARRLAGKKRGRKPKNGAEAHA